MIGQKEDSAWILIEQLPTRLLLDKYYRMAVT